MSGDFGCCTQASATITEPELAEALAMMTGWKVPPCHVDAGELFRIAAERREAETACEPSREAGPSTEPPEASSSRLGQAQQRTGAVPALPVGAVFDPAALRERIASALDPDSPAGTVIDALMAGVIGPLRERAERAGAALERITAERDALTGEVAVLESRLATREGRHAR